MTALTGLVRSGRDLIQRALGARSRLLQPWRAAHPFGTAEAGRVLDCTVAYNVLGGYCLPGRSAHRPAVRTVMAGEVWERETIDLVCRNVADGDVVHAGTYFGDFLPAFSHACVQGSRVWAFEPNNESFRCAEVTLKINALENVSLMNVALGPRLAAGVVMTTDAAGREKGGSSYVVSDPNMGPCVGAQAVSIVSLDDIIPAGRRVSVMQLDVEGSEQMALSGALETITRCRPLLILETLPDDDWIALHLRPLGYKVVGIVHHNTVLSIEPLVGAAEALDRQRPVTPPTEGAGRHSSDGAIRRC